MFFTKPSSSALEGADGAEAPSLRLLRLLGKGLDALDGRVDALDDCKSSQDLTGTRRISRLVEQERTTRRRFDGRLAATLSCTGGRQSGRVRHECGTAYHSRKKRRQLAVKTFADVPIRKLEEAAHLMLTKARRDGCIGIELLLVLEALMRRPWFRGIPAKARQ